MAELRAAEKVSSTVDSWAVLTAELSVAVTGRLMAENSVVWWVQKWVDQRVALSA
jgi:hypothetical protein